MPSPLASVRHDSTKSAICCSSKSRSTQSPPVNLLLLGQPLYPEPSKPSATGPAALPRALQTFCYWASRSTQSPPVNLLLLGQPLYPEPSKPSATGPAALPRALQGTQAKHRAAGIEPGTFHLGANLPPSARKQPLPSACV
ncbi:unnamed protein product [Arctogadus glacialis]